MVLELTKRRENRGAQKPLCPNCRQSEMIPDAATVGFRASGENESKIVWCVECGLTTSRENLPSMALAE